MAETVFTVQEAGIDWITATAQGKDAGGSLACLAETIVDLHVTDGYKRRRWAQWGFTGESARFASYGRRGDDTVLVLSGAAADTWFGGVLARATNISRIDLQVTVKGDPPQEGIAWRHYGELLRAGPNGRRGATASHITESGGGSTTYVGRRISDKWLRIYDKGRESADEQYAGCWRYELEIKNQPAWTTASSLATFAHRPSAVTGAVFEYCRTHGLRPVFSTNDYGLYIPAPRPPSDLERKCNWLATTVSKTAVEIAECLGVDGLLGILNVSRERSSDGSRTDGPVHGHHSYEPDLGPLSAPPEEDTP